ncbi:ceramide synthase 5-like [Mizuhopecten yessoensis]|uniref:ceramide synthase 5-like n=1 Tax=Mizuhopecten yessoensis TaxID=6573 RepID=UPI000B45F15D|nr:ceramide synthase 5-like [Mizuhopecten yessoensis]
MANFQALRDWFWDEKFWLLSNATWDDFENPPPGVYYPLERHILLPSLLIGVLLIGIRLAYERLLVIPFALYMGLTFKKHYAVEKNPSLEAVYATDKYPEQDQVQELSKKTSLTERQIQRWFRHRRSREMPGRMQKFRECSWHFLFYSSSFFSAIYILWDKPYFWESKYCWIDYKHQHVSNDVFWFYTIELAFYWNLVFTVLSDHKRKDSTQMFIHHMVTIALIYFSFAINTVRIGALVIVVHDSVDLWMAGAKMANYLKKDTLTDTMFGIFFVVWLLTRLYIYPFKMVWSASFESLQYQAMWPSYWLLNGLLWILQVLHVIWTFMILRIVLNKFTGEKKVKDVRSDTEESTGKEEEGEKSQERDVIVNGSPTLRSPDSVGRRKKCKA